MTDPVRRGLLTAGLLLPLAASAQAQESWEEKHQRQLKEDWPWLSRYAEDNAKLLASGTKTNIVFMGDSITEGWFDKRPGFFTRGRIDRGIGGQTTSQMVLRMFSDVVALNPKAVHIMAGTNDIAGNTGPMTAEMTQNNFRAMSDIARSEGIKVLLAPIPPAASFPWRPGLETRPRIAELNRWLERFARESGASWVDYRRVLDDGTGAMKPGLAADGVHPTEAGYDAMATVIEPILRRTVER